MIQMLRKYNKKQVNIEIESQLQTKTFYWIYQL